MAAPLMSYASHNRALHMAGVLELLRFSAIIPQNIQQMTENLPVIGAKMEDPSASLKRIDIKMLRALRAEGQLTNVELATCVNVSPATCHRGSQRLFEEGYIAGVTQRLRL